MPKSTFNPDELRNRFRAPQRIRQFPEVTDMVRIEMRQVSDEMDDNGSGDGMGELQALFAQERLAQRD